MWTKFDHCSTFNWSSFAGIDPPHKINSSSFIFLLFVAAQIGTINSYVNLWNGWLMRINRQRWRRKKQQQQKWVGVIVCFFLSLLLTSSRECGNNTICQIDGLLLSHWKWEEARERESLPSKYDMQMFRFEFDTRDSRNVCLSRRRASTAKWIRTYSLIDEKMMTDWWWRLSETDRYILLKIFLFLFWVNPWVNALHSHNFWLVYSNQQTRCPRRNSKTIWFHRKTFFPG